MRGRVGKGKGGPVSSAAGPLTLPGRGASRRRRRADLFRGAKMIRESTIREALEQEKFPPRRGPSGRHSSAIGAVGTPDK
jgi:hypothetical protein